jgi:hypothetical protein
VAWAALCLFVLASRLCHIDLFWVEEAYGAAAASEILNGKYLYRDIWFDKPPLYALIYVLWGAAAGLPLRIAGGLYVLLSCFAAAMFARDVWGKREGLAAAWLLAVFLTFGIPSAVIALAPDLLMIPLHIAAVHLAYRRRPFAAGFAAGVATLFNGKGLFVLLVCGVWIPPQAARLLIGFAVPQALPALWGAWPDYWRQVWVWGAGYSADTFVANVWAEGTRRTLNWAGFHAALIAGSIWWAARERSWRMLAWAAISFTAVCAGFRFFPRYYFHLLPVFTLTAARGLVIAPRALRYAAIALLLVPAVRFGPRYVQLAADAIAGRTPAWSDTAMMSDSAEAAALARQAVPAGSTLLVWGYRPDVFVFSGMPAGTRYLDSQPLTGVLADRHLTAAKPTFPDLAAANRAELAQTAPTVIVDGLGPINAALAIGAYQDLSAWLAGYEVVGATRMSRVYRLRSPDRGTLR